MLVKDIMTKDVKTSHVGDTVEETALQMKRYDTGFVPVVDANNQVVGVITDRDIAMQSAAQHKSLRDMQTMDIAGKKSLYCCHPDDDVNSAMKIMRTEQVHRLPVVDSAGQIEGVLGLGDILDNTSKDYPGQIPPQETIGVIKDIYR